MVTRLRQWLEYMLAEQDEPPLYQIPAQALARTAQQIQARQAVLERAIAAAQAQRKLAELDSDDARRQQWQESLTTLQAQRATVQQQQATLEQLQTDLQQAAQHAKNQAELTEQQRILEKQWQRLQAQLAEWTNKDSV